MQEGPDRPSRFRDMTLDAFAERLASSEPVPGGGSASAVAAALGAALVAMVARLSEGRPKYARYSDLHAEGLAAGTRLADLFLTLADQDAAAYGAFALALKLPHETQGEQILRREAVQEAALEAARVPMSCVEACRELVQTAEALAGRSNQNASSDLVVAVLLGDAAAKGAAQNVLVNLPAIGDGTAAAALAARVQVELAEVERLAAMTRETVAAGTLR